MIPLYWVIFLRHVCAFLGHIPSFIKAGNFLHYRSLTLRHKIAQKMEKLH